MCPKCGVKDAPFNIKSRGLYQCRQCNHQASVTAGTIMDRSQTDFDQMVFGDLSDVAGQAQVVGAKTKTGA